MADLAANFKVLQNSGSGAGVPWHLAVEGETTTAKNMGGMFIGQDASGNFLMPEVTAARALKVDTEEDNIVDLDEYGENSGSTTPVTIFDIALQNSMEYKDIEWVMNCFRDSVFEILHIDDLGGGGETENMKATILAGPGDFNDSGKKTSRFTTGATGTQVLRVRAYNLTNASTLRAGVSVKEVQ